MRWVPFDGVGVPRLPSFVLANQVGDKIGLIDHISDLVVDSYMSVPDTCTFQVQKECAVWDDILDLKTCWVPEYDAWYKMTVRYQDDATTTKSVELTGLGESETSQIYVESLEANTEADIARSDYEPTVIYDPAHPERSLLHRVLSACPHYAIGHVDAALAGIQRSFSFSHTDVYTALQEIAAEIDGIVIFDNGSDPYLRPSRTISLYASETYGLDTPVLVDMGGLADSIAMETDAGSRKNCFRLSGGDDIMTAAIRSCLLDPSGCLWIVTDEMMADMPAGLAAKLKQYEAVCEEINERSVSSLEPSTRMLLRTLFRRAGITPVSDYSSLVGYPALIRGIYELIDLRAVYADTLLPAGAKVETTAAQEAAKLTASSMGVVAVPDSTYTSSSTASSAALGLAKATVNPNFKVDITVVSFSYPSLVATYTISSYADENDTATTGQITSTISNDYQTYINQRITKVLSRDTIKDASIVSLFNEPLEDFKTDIYSYSLSGLQGLLEACQACMDVMIEQGISDKDAWISRATDLYTNLYVPYTEKHQAIAKYMKLVEQYIAGIDEAISTLDARQAELQAQADLSAFLTQEEWLQLQSYRREDTYQNQNYFGTGLDTAHLFERVQDFMNLARVECEKAALPRTQISASVLDLFSIPEFAPLRNSFKCGNWIRAKVEGVVYKFRLTGFHISFSDLTHIETEFSTAVRVTSSAKAVSDKINAAASMASTYGFTVKQAAKGATSKGILDDWVANGLDATNVKIMNDADSQDIVYDRHGLLLRKWDEITQDFDPAQMRLINRTLAMTTDNWATTKAAFGEFLYQDPVSGDYVTGWGVNGEMLVGKLILGQQLGIYNASGSMTFDNDGLVVKNPDTGVYTRIDPASNDIFGIYDSSDNAIMTVSRDGAAYFSGEVRSSSGKIGGWTIDSYRLGGEKAYNETTYRVQLNTPDARMTAPVFIYSSEKSTDGTYKDKVLIQYDGLFRFGDYLYSIASDSSVRVGTSSTFYPNEIAGAYSFTGQSIKWDSEALQFASFNHAGLADRNIRFLKAPNGDVGHALYVVDTTAGRAIIDYTNSGILNLQSDTTIGGQTANRYGDKFGLITNGELSGSFSGVLILTIYNGARSSTIVPKSILSSTPLTFEAGGATFTVAYENDTLTTTPITSGLIISSIFKIN